MRSRKRYWNISFILVFLLLVTGIFYIPAQSMSRLFLGNQIKKDGLVVFVYPNTVRIGQKPILHLESKVKGPYKATIFDLNGKKVMSKMVFHSNAVSLQPDRKFRTEIPLDKKRLAAGVYFGRLEGIVSDNQAIQENFRFTVVN